MLFAFILLLLTASGTFFPCCTQDDCANEVSTSTSGGDGDHDKGACSPFFACATCPGAAELHKIALAPAPEIEITMHWQTVYLERLSTFSSSFFQPPRFRYS